MREPQATTGRGRGPHPRAPALTTRPLCPKLHRQLGLVLRRDKILHKGLRETMKAVEGLG